jgi:hypothetical protein
VRNSGVRVGGGRYNNTCSLLRKESLSNDDVQGMSKSSGESRGSILTLTSFLGFYQIFGFFVVHFFCFFCFLFFVFFL